MKLRALVCFIAALLATAPVAAAVVFQSRSWNAGFGTPDTITFDPFDPDLGTLTRVEVTLSGVMVLRAFASPYQNGPYSFAVISKLDANSPGGTGFDFGSPAQWLTSLTATGNGNEVVAVAPFELAFEFDLLSDLTGTADLGGFSGFTQPPITINGRRSDFVEDLVNQLLGIQQQWFVPELPQVIGAPVPVQVTRIDFSGGMQLDYIYEARQDVPEPGGVALLGLALAGLAVAAPRRLRRGRPAP
jgi:hypothetical protein